MFISHSVEETRRFGRRHAEHLAPGDVVALTGDLGAGKTQFVKGVVEAFGGDEEVTSPTFTLIHEYRAGRVPIYHFDFYRLNQREEVLRLGLDDYLEGDGISLIEWADRFPDLLPRNTEWISIDAKSESERLIAIRPPP